MCFFKLIKVHFLVSELYIYIYQNARSNNKKKKYFTRPKSAMGAGTPTGPFSFNKIHFEH